MVLSLLSLNCLILGQASENCFTEDIGERYFDNNNVKIEFSELNVSHLKEKILRRKIIKYITQSSKHINIDLWKVDSKKVDDEVNNLKEFTEDDIKDKLEGEIMIPRYQLNEYFDVNEIDDQGIHIFVVPTSTGKCLPNVLPFKQEISFIFLSTLYHIC
jgi:hypothetical protein